jgi:hypothetical protein
MWSHIAPYDRDKKVNLILPFQIHFCSLQLEYGGADILQIF